MVEQEVQEVDEQDRHPQAEEERQQPNRGLRVYGIGFGTPVAPSRHGSFQNPSVGFRV